MFKLCFKLNDKNLYLFYTYIISPSKKPLKNHAGLFKISNDALWLTCYDYFTDTALIFIESEMI